ncbi:Beta-galactosidase BglY [compost metagenome]
MAQVIKTELPPGVTAQSRTDGTNDYVFVMNFSGGSRTVALDEAEYRDAESGAAVEERELQLPVDGIRILVRQSQ